MALTRRFKLRLPLPERIPSVRPVRDDDDLQKIASWISAGRVERCFAGGQPVSVGQLETYIKQQSSKHDQYAIFVILCGDKACGFVDFTRSGEEVELLGIYIEPQQRRHRLASWIVRLFCAEWLYAGILNVDARIYIENRSSLRLFESLGFVPIAEELEATRQVIVMRRMIPKLERVSSPLSGYRRLKGENIVAGHLAFATLLSEQLAKFEGVQLVLGLGSVARGFADKWSDIDIAVLGTGTAVNSLWRGERWFGEFDVDLFVVDLQLEPPSGWDEARRQAFSEAVVLSNANRGLAKAIKQRARPSKSEIRKISVEKLFALAWIGFAPPAWKGRKRFGYYWSLQEDLWIQRGCIPSAHNTVDQALNLFLELIFLANGVLPPDPKWRRFLVSDLSWLPHSFGSLLAIAESGARTKRGFSPRSKALMTMVGEVASHLESQALIPSNMYAYHLRHSGLY